MCRCLNLIHTESVELLRFGLGRSATVGPVTHIGVTVSQPSSHEQRTLNSCSADAFCSLHSSRAFSLTQTAFSAATTNVRTCSDSLPASSSVFRVQAAVMPSATTQIKSAAWAFIAFALIGWILCLIGLAGGVNVAGVRQLTSSSERCCQKHGFRPAFGHLHQTVSRP